MRKLTRKLHDGFSLIELIITIVVLGLVFVPLGITVARYVDGAFYSDDLGTAKELARMEMEKVNNTAYASILTSSSSNYEGYPFDMTRTVTYAQGDAGTTESLKKIVVDIKKSGSSTVLVSLVTYIAKNVSCGI